MTLLLGAALTALLICLFFIVRLYIVVKTGPNYNPGAKGPVAVLVVAGSGGHTTEILRLLEYMSAAYTPRHYVIADTDRMSEEKICTFEKIKQQSHSKSQFTICRIPRSREVHQSWSSSVVSTLNALRYSLPLVFRIRPDMGLWELLLVWPLTKLMRAGEVVIMSDQRGEDYSAAAELYDDFSRLHSSSVWFPVNPNSLSLSQSWGHLFIPSPSAFMSEQPSLVLCNGPGTCIPLCLAGLLLGILGTKKVLIVYVESICRVHTLSLTGKILYPLSDYFFVQWSSLRDKYPKSIFLGRIV